MLTLYPSTLLSLLASYSSFFFLNTSLLEYNCFTILCQFLLYNRVNQPYAYIYPHIPSLLSLPPTLHISPLQAITKHQADLPVLCCCCSLAYYFTFYTVYMLMLLSLHLSLPPPLPCPQVRSLCLHLYSCPSTRFSTDGQKAHEKMLNITNYQRNANENYNDIELHELLIYFGD